jgi:hypothetical protein
VVALVDRSLAEYNAHPGEGTGSSWGADSDLYIFNPWTGVTRYGSWPTWWRGRHVERVGAVVQVGELNGRGPFTVAFAIMERGAKPDEGSIWVQQWYPTGDRILRFFMI